MNNFSHSPSLTSVYPVPCVYLHIDTLFILDSFKIDFVFQKRCIRILFTWVSGVFGTKHKYFPCLTLGPALGNGVGDIIITFRRKESKNMWCDTASPGCVRMGNARSPRPLLAG
jgi:hypothetical protein